ncbi:MAG: YhgE/Pip domain-containing protein [Coriobacteriaceae bacterium]|nr:YhgE/Pip domain-containing protein [Coriobacteriaceae bacterium]
MKNIIKLFRRDLSRVRKSVIAMIVAVGLVIVPVLYAWFNIAGSWDPYGNTGNLKVAVANADAGYKSDLIPVKVNMGESVVSSLRANDQIGWEFVDEDEALEGVKSGAYYAAVVIPKSFSADMMTLFSDDVKHAQILYYENQKASAIAPRVTDKAAGTVRQQIDETFTETIGSAGLVTASSLLDFMNSDQVAAFVGNLTGTLDTGASSLRDASDSVTSFAEVVGSSTGVLQSTSDLLAQAGSTSAGEQGIVDDAKKGLSSLGGALDAAVEAVNGALKDSAGNYDAAGKAIEDAFDTVGGHVDTTVEQLGSVSAAIAQDAANTRALQEQIRALEDKIESSSLPGAVKDELVQKIDTAQNSVGNIANQQELMAKSLSDAAASLTTHMDEAKKQLKDAKDLIAQAKNDLSQVHGTYDEQLKQQLDALAGTFSGIAENSGTIADSLNATVEDLSGAAGSLAQNLDDAHQALVDAAAGLASSADELVQIKDELNEAVTSGDLDRVRDLIGSDPAALADSLAAPVALDRKPVYHIENYGSAMAPFYTVLSLWVGGIVLAAMLKAQVDEATARELAPICQHELYLGRYAFFALLALLQATLVCAGDLLFFGIQCAHPLQFMLVGWVAGFVFSNIVYTLTVSFGDVGKAIAVVLLVMQVAGSGGTFPIEMTADFFQDVYPFLPFTHAINAMHAAMAGAYGMEFWTELGILASYLLPSLALGLVLRRPVIRANAWIAEKLEETKLM